MSPGQVPNLIPSATVAQWLSRGRASVRAVGAHLTGRRTGGEAPSDLTGLGEAKSQIEPAIWDFWDCR